MIYFARGENKDRLPDALLPGEQLESQTILNIGTWMVKMETHTK